MDYGGLIRAHINHTSTYTEEGGGIIGSGGIKGLGRRARLVVFGISTVCVCLFVQEPSNCRYKFFFLGC